MQCVRMIRVDVSIKEAQVTTHALPPWASRAQQMLTKMTKSFSYQVTKTLDHVE